MQTPACYILYMATPLTLSEVRSMLPPDVTADLASPAEHADLRRLHPAAQTVVRLFAGGCSCDLVRARQSETRSDERELRARWFRAGLSRDQVIAALEPHRRGGARTLRAHRAALAAFVVEHARNAGPTLYQLRFGTAPTTTTPAGPVVMSAAQVRAHPDTWLVEGRPVLVTPREPAELAAP
ncbi:MAG TPA: hypothetical protein VFW66_12350 [Gemmatimonadales bacterium]|nr:hypothetical protein [Gemmatimonadales bacterium]